MSGPSITQLAAKSFTTSAIATRANRFTITKSVFVRVRFTTGMANGQVISSDRIFHHRDTEGTKCMKDNFRLYAFVSTTVFARVRLLFLFLCVLCVSVVNLPAQDFKTVHPGVEYAQVDHKIGTDPVKINLLCLDLTKVGLQVRHALDKAIGLETTSSIAIRRNAVAAINGGFFRLDKSEFAGDAAGSLVVDGEMYSESLNGRAALTLVASKQQTFFTEIGHLNLYARVHSHLIEFPEIKGINRERKNGEIILYSDKFGRSTRTAEGVEVIIDKCQQREVYKTPQTFCSRFKVMEGMKDSIIPQGGFVLSIHQKNAEFVNLVDRLKQVSQMRKKDRRLLVQAAVGQVFPYYGFFEKGGGLFITNGVPQLIKNGKIDITWEQEKSSKSFVETRHPRTAVAKMKDGKFLMVTVDGRQPGVSVGMNLNELAEYLLSLGAVDAMNLDGGGSTTMFLDGKVVNKPSDKEGERKVGDAILVTLRKGKK